MRRSPIALFLRAFIPYTPCLFMLIGSGIYFSRIAHILVTHATCTLHGPVSEKARQDIFAFLDHACTTRTQPQRLITSLKQEFPWIDTASIQVQPERAHITITVHEPSIALNNTWLVTAQGICFAKDAFIDAYTPQIPNITIAQEAFDITRTPQGIALFARDIPHDVFDVYACQWHDTHHISFTDKQHRFTIQTASHTAVSTDLLCECLHIKGEIIKQGLLKNRKNDWIADTRFSDRIIVAKGGTSYGSHVS